MVWFPTISHLVTVSILLLSRLLSTQQHHLMMLVPVEVSWMLLRLTEGMVLWETMAGSTVAWISTMWVYMACSSFSIIVRKQLEADFMFGAAVLNDELLRDMYFSFVSFAVWLWCQREQQGFKNEFEVQTLLKQDALFLLVITCLWYSHGAKYLNS